MTSSTESLARLPLCSVASREFGDDPIGSAPSWDTALALELSVPEWDRYRDLSTWSPSRKELFGRLGEWVKASGRGFGLLLYTGRGEAGPRARLYRRPGRLFASYERADYRLGPALSAEDLLEAAILEPARLPALEEHRLSHEPGLDFHVCTHGSVDAACGKEGFPLYVALEEGGSRAWRTAHFGGHRFAPTMVEMPAGRFWGHLTPEIAASIAARSGPLEPVARCLRGWTGLDFFGQIADRACLLREGWGWLDWAKTGETLEVTGGDGGNPASSAFPPERALVRLELARPDGSGGAYLAEIEPQDFVNTRGSSHKPDTSRANRYRVARLARE